jgi:hypothetical protein
MTYTNELIELKMAVSSIPEIKEDVKELVRAIKGSNGDLGLSARVAQVEKLACENHEQMASMNDRCERHRNETNQLIRDRFDKLFNTIQDNNKERISKLEEEEDAREGEHREVRKDKRNFWIGVGLGLIPKIVDWILTLF